MKKNKGLLRLSFTVLLMCTVCCFLGLNQIYAQSRSTSSETLKPGTDNGSSQDDNSYLVYPNPAKETLHVESQQLEIQPVSIILYNLAGEKIKEINNENLSVQKMKLDFSDLRRGLYFIKILREDKVLRKQLILLD